MSCIVEDEHRYWGQTGSVASPSTVSEADLWAAIDAAVMPPDIIEKPPGWFTVEEYVARHPEMTYEAARSLLKRAVQGGKLSTARSKRTVDGFRRTIRIYGVKS